MTQTSPLNATSTYVVLAGDGAASTIAGDARFWSALVGGELPEVERGTLIAALDADGSFSGWERHPRGEELVLLIAGSVEVVLERERGEELIRLAGPGDYVLVPRNVWHRSRALTPSKLLFVTYGSGTEHRPS